jgi:hypothetical protein
MQQRQAEQAKTMRKESAHERVRVGGQAPAITKNRRVDVEKTRDQTRGEIERENVKIEERKREQAKLQELGVEKRYEKADLARAEQASKQMQKHDRAKEISTEERQRLERG